MRIIALAKWLNFRYLLSITFFGLCLIFFNFLIATGVTDKSPSVNILGHSSPSSPSSTWYIFWDEHMDWQTTGNSGFYSHATRNQPIGSYIEIIADYPGGSLYNSLIAYFNRLGAHPYSAFAHFKNNTFYQPGSASAGDYRFVPGWNPSQNDLDNNWQRDYEADYDYNNSLNTRFTVNYTNYYLQDNNKNWASNKWKRDYCKLGWGGNIDTVSFRVDSSTATRIYVHGNIPTHTYNWFIVDDSSARDHNAVAMTDSQSFINFWVWGLTYFNFSDDRVKAWAGGYCNAIVDQIARDYKAPGWLFIDDIQRDYWVQNRMMGGASLENWENSFKNDIISYYKRIKDSVGNSVIYGNIGDYTTPAFDTVCQNFNGIWHEFFIQTHQENWTFTDKFNSLKRQRNSPWAIKQRIHFLHATGGAQEYNDLNRNKIGSLAWYYIVKDDSTYFLFDTEPSYGTNLGDTTRWWFGLMGVDIGTPRDTAVEVLESGAYVWKRPFSSGYVIFKPKPGSSSNYTDATVHSLPRYFYRLDVNGNIVGDSVNQVSLRNAEGVVLLSTGGGTQSQLAPPQPLSPQDGATVDTSSPTLIILNTQDSAGRPLLYYFELDMNTQFNSQAKKESTPFELEAGQDSTTRWPVPTPLSSGVYYWRSRAYTNTYPSDTSQPTPVYHFLIPGTSFRTAGSGGIHVSPNPFKPSPGQDFVTFRNIPLYSKITITTLSGELVKELTGNTSTDVIWDVKNMEGRDLASGVYYCRVDFQSGSSTGKLAVIR